MRRHFLQYLADPETGEPLELSAGRQEGDRVVAGSLRSSRAAYPIVNGIPRFVPYKADSSYVNSFSYQWQRWRMVQFESANKGGPMERHTLRMWERIVGQMEGRLDGQVVGDFGCGPGRFIEIVRIKGGRAIGLDMSDAVESAQERFWDDPEVLICQADVLKPPLRRQCLDGSFTIGVLHHTPNPAAGLKAISRVTKPKGWTAVAVYSKGSYYDSALVRSYRFLFRPLWRLFGPYPVLFYSYLAAYVLRPLARLPGGIILKALFPFVRLPDAKWSLLDTFDSLTPTYQSAHVAEEVREWFEKCGLTDIAASDWGTTSFHARNPAE